MSGLYPVRMWGLNWRCLGMSLHRRRTRIFGICCDGCSCILPFPQPLSNLSLPVSWSGGSDTSAWCSSSLSVVVGSERPRRMLEARLHRGWSDTTETNVPTLSDDDDVGDGGVVTASLSHSMLLRPPPSTIPASLTMPLPRRPHRSILFIAREHALLGHANSLREHSRW